MIDEIPLLSKAFIERESAAPKGLIAAVIVFNYN